MTKTKLGWETQIMAGEMCTEMHLEDLKRVRRHALLKAYGLEQPVAIEG